MNFSRIDLPVDWQVKPIREAYRFTRKPRGITVADSISVPFLPGAPRPIRDLPNSLVAQDPGVGVWRVSLRAIAVGQGEEIREASARSM